jgi:tripartite-type tricarboxylate transporter receptor subunit TctC
MRSDFAHRSTAGLMLVSVIVALAACAPASPASPTAPTAKAPADVSSPAAKPAGSPAAASSPAPAASPAAAAAAQPAAKPDPAMASVWAGKTVTLIVGSEAGSGYDTWGRLFGRYIGSHIPGNPTIVVQNMPGGVHRAATNFVAQAKPDGLTIQLVGRGIPDYQLRGETAEQGVRYDVTKFNWLGSATQDAAQIFAVLQRSGVTPDQLQKLETTPIKIGQQEAGSPTHTGEVILKEALGWNLQAVFGYAGNDAILSLVRGEIDGVIADWVTMQKDFAEQLAGKTLVPVLILGDRQTDPALTSLKTLDELLAGKADDVRQIYTLYRRPFSWARPFAAPPGTPTEIVATLRAAVTATLTDPEYLADAQRAKMDIKPVSGERIQELITEHFRTSPELIKRLDDWIKADTPG